MPHSMPTFNDRKRMKIREIILLAWLSLLVGCTTTPQEQSPKPKEENRIPEQAKEVETLTIRASGTVYVLVKTRSSNEQLFRDTLSEGESAIIEVDSPVDVLFTAGEYLVLEWKGEELKPSSSGTAKLTLK